MEQIELERLANNLVSKFGLPIKASHKSSPDGEIIIIEPEGIHPNEGFQVHIKIGWRSLFFELSLGKFAADLLEQMEKSSLEKKHIFSNVAEQILNEKGVIILNINNESANPLKPEEWGSNWKIMSFSLKKSPIEINTDDLALTGRLINIWTERFFGCIIAISPLVETEENNEVLGLPEGALKKVLVNRYERSQYNRTLCINFHGYNCKVCNLNFSEKYGDIGNNYIHVHHVISVSQLGTNYIVNPIKDLIPVCPNCHAMLHRKDPPYKINELKSLIASFKNE